VQIKAQLAGIGINYTLPVPANDAGCSLDERGSIW
jgi:hypothetical protein